MGILDPNNMLPGLQWKTREKVKRLGKEFEQATGLQLRIRSGRRSCAQQFDLYAQGRTRGGSIVTGANGCRSWHVMGRAIDADPVDAYGRRSTSRDVYAVAGAIWRSLGGVWGGDFKNLDDIGHFEYHPGLTIDQACPVPSQCTDGSVETKKPIYLAAAPSVVFSVGLAGGLLLAKVFSR